MTEHSGEHSGESFSDGLDPSLFENPTQRRLTSEYTRLTGINKESLSSFDPEQSSTTTRIQLETRSQEAEEKEATVSRAKRETMLRQLGLYPILDNPTEHPDVMIHQDYQDGVFDQIRTVTNESGKLISVTVTGRRKADGTVDIENVALVSNDLVQQLQQEIEVRAAEYMIDQRLSSEFGIDQGFAQLANLSPEDKQGMLDSYDQINSLQVAEVDLSYLDKTRKRLVKAMLPSMSLLKNRRERYLSHYLAQYQHEIQQIVNAAGNPEQERAALLQRERLLRLSALKRQLDGRKRFTKAVLYGEMATAIGGAVALGAGGGVVLSYESPITPLQGLIVGAGIGLTSGGKISAEAIREFRERSKRVGDFSGMRDQFRIGDQITDEQRLASRYFDDTAAP
jgi:hypothetical protein